MELRQLRYFVAICHDGSLTRAGERLHISQQSLSTVVSKLEAEIGVQLLQRSVRGVQATAAGRVLCQRAAALLADADAAARATQQAAALGPGTVTLRYGLDAEHLVEPIMAAVRRQHPELSISGWTAPDVDNLQAVHDATADLAFAWALPPGSELNTLLVGHERTLAAVPDDHPLAGLEEIAVEAMAGRELITFPRAAAPLVWDHIASHFQADGRLSPRMQQTAVSGQSGMVDHAVNTTTITTISAGLSNTLARPGMRFVPFAPPLTIPLQLVWRTGAPPAAAQVIATVEALTEQAVL